MFDAILFLSYGGPESPDEVKPFLDRILSGKSVPSSRQDEICERYLLLGGVSPLPRACRRFLAKLKTAFHENGEEVGVYWANLFARPFIAEAFDEMERDGVERVLVLKSSAFGSTPSCRRYLDALEGELSRRETRLVVRTVPPFFETRAFLDSVASSILTTLAETPTSTFGAARLILFTAHSIPVAESDSAQYRRQLLHACVRTIETAFPGSSSVCAESDAFSSSTIAFATPEGSSQIPENLRARLRDNGLDAALAFQSRSGSPFVPWLEPDVNEFLRGYKRENPSLETVVVVPIGFFFENMETIYDLDVEARKTCEDLGIEYRRAPCVGDSPIMADATRKLTLLEPDSFPICSCVRGRCDFSCRRSPLF